MKYNRTDRLIYNDMVVEIVDRDPHSRGYLVITLEDKGKVGGIVDLVVPENVEKIEIKATSNPFAKKKEVTEVPAIPVNYKQYEDMMNHTFWVKEKDLRKINFKPNWLQRLLLRLI